MDSIIFPLLLCIFIVDSALSQQEQNTCPKNDLSVPRRKTDHGSLKGFFAIAKGISDTIQPRISEDTVQKIKAGASGGGFSSNQLEPEIKSLLHKQTGTLVFFGFGIVVAVLSLFCGLSILLSRCCCSVKSNSSKPSSTARYAVPLLLVPVFILLFTGVVINNQSSRRLFKAAEGSREFVTTTKTDLLNLYNNGIESVLCEVNSQINITVEKVRQIAKTTPENLLNDAKERLRLSALEDNAVELMLSEAKIAKESCTSIKQALQDLKSAALGTPQCKRGLDALQKIVDTVDPLPKNIEELNKYKDAFSTNGDAYKNLVKNINSHTDKMEEPVHKEWSKIYKSIDENNEISDMMIKAEKTIIDAIDWVTSSKPYKLIKSEFPLLVTIPGVITILFILFTAILSIMRLHFPQASSKIANETITGYCFKIVMVGFYIIILFGSLILTLSSMEYLIGALFSGGCKTVFEDESLSIFSSLEEKVNLAEVELKLNGRVILMKCKEDKPLLPAIGASSVISADTLLKKLNLPSLKQGFLEEVKKLKLSVSEILSQIPKLKELAKKLETNFNGLSTGLNSIQISLDDCKTVNQDKRNDVRESSSKIAKSIENLKNGTKNFETSLGKVASSSDSDAIIEALANKYFDKFENILKNELSRIENELIAKLFRCGGIYTIYENFGTYLCQDVAGPIHGIWASSGLCGLCCIFTSIVLLCIDRIVSSYGPNV